MHSRWVLHVALGCPPTTICTRCTTQYSTPWVHVLHPLHTLLKLKSRNDPSHWSWKASLLATPNSWIKKTLVADASTSVDSVYKMYRAFNCLQIIQHWKFLLPCIFLQRVRTMQLNASILLQHWILTSLDICPILQHASVNTWREAWKGKANWSTHWALQFVS